MIMMVAISNNNVKHCTRWQVMGIVHGNANNDDINRSVITL